MKVVFLTYGTSPVPATKGGAVENLIEDLLDKNEKHHLLDITVFSVYEDTALEKAKKYKYTKFKFVKCPKIISIGDRCIYGFAKYALKKENLISYRFILRRLYVMSHYPKFLIQENYDRVVLVTNSTLFFVMKNKKVAQKYKDKIVYYLHNEVRSLFKCEKEAASIRTLIGVSQFVNDAFSKQVPTLKEEQIYVLKNCIDTKSFLRFDEKKLCFFRKIFEIKNNDFVVIFAGRIVAEKGVLETIEAIETCGRHNIKLLIVGGGFYSSDIKDKYAARLRERAETMNNRIIFTGYIDYDDMPFVYQVGNVAVLPSIWEEPAGMTMVEAAISGIPLITTNSGGIPEYISSDIAIMVERDENLIKNISNAILNIMDDSVYATKLGEKGKTLADELNLKNYYFNFVDIIER